MSDIAAWREHRDGQCPRQLSKDTEESKLGCWLHKQRSQHREGVLSSDRAAELEKHLGPIWNAHTSGFQEHVEALRKMYARAWKGSKPRRFDTTGIFIDNFR